MTTLPTLEEARALDAQDPLRARRAEFLFPRPPASNAEPIYLVGNSLGLQPKRARDYVLQELAAWAKHGVEGHFVQEDAPDAPIEPWLSYHELFTERGARLVGALPGEVVAMGSLTANLHTLMVSFYRPTPKRSRIVIEAGAFPSDRYAVMSQARFHRFDPDEAVVELAPRAGEDLLRTEDVLRFIAEQGDDVALFLMGGVNYYTGQLFDIRAITRAAQDAGIVVGWDLAHAAGNAPLALHDDDVDFAAWCTYKYLNSGPGAVGMAFVHERHARAHELPRFWGWWGNDPATRFAMGRSYTPQSGAAGWQVSNAPVLSMACLHASLEQFDAVGMPALRRKSEALTAFLERVVDGVAAERPGKITQVTPRTARDRGAQLSLRVQDPEKLAERLLERGAYVDVRRPDVIRAAPVPLYNSFEDCWRFGAVLREVL